MFIAKLYRMGSFVSNCYQLVWSTKHREPVLEARNREVLYTYIKGILKEKRCNWFAVNGVEDHIHIGTHVHQSICIADLVKDIKLATHDLIDREQLFPYFLDWQSGYAAFSYHADSKESVRNYIERQVEHHADGFSSREEMFALLTEHRLPYRREYLE